MKKQGKRPIISVFIETWTKHDGSIGDQENTDKMIAYILYALLFHFLTNLHHL